MAPESWLLQINLSLASGGNLHFSNHACVCPFHGFQWIMDSNMYRKHGALNEGLIVVLQRSKQTKMCLPILNVIACDKVAAAGDWLWLAGGKAGKFFF